jgi:rhomboid protease GluP
MSLFRQHISFGDFIPKYPVSSGIIFFNTLALILTIFTGGFNGLNLYKLGALHSQALNVNEYYRLVTVMFLHGSFMHYIFNTLFGLVILGAGLEKLIGSFKFFILYFASGIISSLIVVMFTPIGLTVGASGAIYGILGIFLYSILFKQHLLSYADRIYIRNLFIINIIFTFLMPRISIPGHIGGAVAGFLLGFILLINVKRQYYQF